MKRLLCLAITFLVVTGCSSKTITWDTMGTKTITTKTEAASLYEARASVIKAYYKSLQSPQVIATMTAPDGTVIAIHNQLLPPMPGIPQHQNQIIGPVADVLKFITGGVVVDRMVRGIVRGAGDVIVNGDGNSVDKSDRIASDSEAMTTVEKDNDKSVFTDQSQHDSGWVDSNDTDNSLADSQNPDNSNHDSGWVDSNDTNNSINDSYNPDSSTNDSYNIPNNSVNDSYSPPNNSINNSYNPPDNSVNDSYNPTNN